MPGVCTGMNRFIRNRRAVLTLAVGFVAVPSVALAATDAVPGDPFKLGQTSHIEKASTVLSGTGQNSDGVLQLRKETGSGVGAVLKIVNEGPGVARRGIDISVPPGQPVIGVSTGAGKATNFDADKLDGKSREDFMPSALYSNGTRAPITGPGGGKIDQSDRARRALVRRGRHRAQRRRHRCRRRRRPQLRQAVQVQLPDPVPGQRRARPVRGHDHLHGPRRAPRGLADLSRRRRRRRSRRRAGPP